MTPTVLGIDAENSTSTERQHSHAWAALGLLGIGMFVIGIVDVVLLWWPIRLGDPQWEFGTISGTFESLPLSTIGLGLLGSALTALSVRKGARVTAATFGLLALWAAAACLFYGLTVAQVLHAVDVAMKQVAIRAVLKTSVLGVTYVALYAALGTYFWKANHQRG